MNNRYYANGKLMISGEYVVKRGAKALAVPLKQGQSMDVITRQNNDEPGIYWHARVMDHDWFNAVVLLPGMEVAVTTDTTVAGRLVELLKALRDLNEGLIRPGCRYEISTQSAFDHSWGLGSSSALIANLAKWAQINPFDLFFRISGGSGYDVATALARGPIVYTMVNHRVQVTPVVFLPPFRHQIWFAYRGHKQDSAESLDIFNRQTITTNQDIETGNSITCKLLQAETLPDFLHAMHEHEVFMSRLLGKKPIQEEIFNDFRGGIKSLGAWGGDFIMVASDQPPDYVRSYFAGKGIQILFTFEELVLV